MNRFVSILAAAIVLIAAAACGSPSPGSTAAGAQPGAAAPDSEFPLPSSVSNFTQTANGGVNFQTGLDLQTTLQFYRNALGKRGLTERSILTSTTDTTFSVVFDGDPSGNAIVVQAVDLGNGTTNVNIRYEDV